MSALMFTKEEIAEFTGYKVPALQLDVLHRRGFYRACMGRFGVVLERGHYKAVLERQAQPPAPDPEPEIDYSMMLKPRTVHWRHRPEHQERLRAEKAAWLAEQEKAEAYRKDNDVRLAIAKAEADRTRPERRAALVRHHAAKRRVAELKRRPPWADMKAIRAFYAEAIRLTRQTGIEHHVDHIIPLQGKLVSGLHVANNLQVLPWRENVLKRNNFEVDA